MRAIYGPNLRVTRIAARIRGILELATTEEYTRGRGWYFAAHDIAREVGAGNVDIGAGIIAALSPNTAWDINIRIAREFPLEPGRNVHTKLQCSKARRILEGEPPARVLRGLKERAFYANIARPHLSRAVTIDRHAARVALGYNLTVDEINNRIKRVGVQPKITRAYTRIAREYCALPSQIQAISWLAYRRAFSDKVDSIPF